MDEPGPVSSVRLPHPGRCVRTSSRPDAGESCRLAREPVRSKKARQPGERGLMQVSERAANEWARENKIAGFNADQLFHPKTNLEAGSWYLHRAMEHWTHQSDPIPFGLAEYNAGASRVQRWSGGNGLAEISEHQFLQKIDFPATRRYVESIIDRYNFYKRRGRM